MFENRTMRSILDPNKDGVHTHIPTHIHTYIQREWTQSTKGRTTQEFFPEVAERLKMKINLTQNFTTMVTGHGKTKSYLHRFKITEAPTCPHGKRDQTTDQLLFECNLLNKERDILKLSVIKDKRLANQQT